MLRFKNYLSEEVLPTAGVKNGVIDIENTAVRGQINATLANVTAQPAVTPYIVLHRISKALSYFHIIMPKRAYLEGDKGVEVVEVKQFGHRMGMTNDGQFIHDVPSKYFLFISYRLASSMGADYAAVGNALSSVGGMFKVTAKLVDEAELQSLLSMAEISLAEDCDAEKQQLKAKAMAPKEGMHTALGDCDCSQGDSPSTKSAVDTSMRRKDKKLSAAELDEEEKKLYKVGATKKDKSGRTVERRDYSTHSSIVATHDKEGKSLQNKWGGYNPDRTGTPKYIGKHFNKMEEETLDEVSFRRLLNYKNERKHDVRATKISASHSRDMSKDPSLSHSKRKEFGDEEKWLRGKQKKMEDGIKLADAKLKGKAKVNAPLPKNPYMEETLDEAKKKKVLVKKKNFLVTLINDPRAKRGGGVMSIPRDQYDPKKHNLASEETIAEKWSKKYKDSINCSNPKGFSQKAHCDGKKKNLDEKLNKAMSAGEVISHFIHSKDPQFEGKSKKKRQKMALGAYYGMHPEKSKLDEMMSRLKKTTAHRKMATGVDTQTRHALDSDRKTETIAVKRIGKPGSEPVRIRKDKFDPSKHIKA